MAKRDITVTFEGFQDLQKVLSEIPKDLSSEKTQLRVMAKAIQIPKAELQENANAVGGNNDKKHENKIEGNVKVKKIGKAGYQTNIGKKAFHAIMVEKGTGQRETKSGANRGSMPSKPFINPAFNTAYPKVVTFLQKEFVTIVDRIVKRHMKAKSKS